MDMKESRNLYDILGVEDKATQDQIKKAYRKLALEHHPDRNAGSTESHKKFVEIGHAYETLSDPSKKQQYDAFGTTDRNGFKHSEDFTETVRRYEERFYKENWDIFLSQIDDSTRILYAGFDPQVNISTARTHTSKSRTLPILKGEKEGSNVVVTSIGHNFHNYFLGVELQEPVAATLLYPISGLFGRYALSGHTDPKGAPAITNFGKIDSVDFNAVGGDGKAKLANILNLGFEKIAYYDFDITNAPEFFKRINVDWFDTEIGRSSVHFEFTDHALPAMPIPVGALYIPTTKEMQELGLAKKVPARSLEYKRDHSPERDKLSEGIVSDNYHRAEWDNMNWTINTPNGLDTAMTAFMLNHVLVPTLSYFEPDRLMLEGKPVFHSRDSLEKRFTI